MNRSNEEWLAHLTGEARVQHAALTDLREALLRGLRRASSRWTPADDAFLEDAVQDSLLRILDRLRQFQGRSRFLTWATAIAIRAALGELRRRRWKDVPLDLAIADADIAPGAAPDRDLGADERRAILEKMHDLIRTGLTEKQRTVLLAELKGMPQDEIARQLGRPRNAIYKLSHDARRRLKRGLETAGFRAEDVHAAFAT